MAFHLQELIKTGKINGSIFQSKNLFDFGKVLFSEMGLVDASGKAKTSGVRVDRDENLTRILDRLILYLRIVHSIDYYGCKFFETEGKF